MDRFPQTVGTGAGTSPTGSACVAGDVMNYYDGNTTTALWNYAQRYAMSDNSYGTTFGPSSPGAINLVSGDTGDVDMTHTANNPSHRDRGLAERRPHRRRLGWLLAHQRRPALLGRLLDPRRGRHERAEHRRRAQRTPASPGAGSRAASGRRRRSPTPRRPPGTPASRPSTLHPRRVQERRLQRVGAALVQPGHLQRRAPRRRRAAEPPRRPGRASTATRTTTSRTTSRSSTTPRRRTRTTSRWPPTATGQDTIGALRTIGTDTQHYVNGQPQFDTPNHQYDTSDFDQLVVGDPRR